MSPALAEVPSQYRTPLEGGGFQADFPYPALHVLLFVPGRALNVSTRATLLLFALLLLALLAARASPWSEVAVAAFLLAHTLVPFSVGGSSDVVWATLLAAAAAAWCRPLARAVLVGLALAYKQPAWVAAPFLWVRLHRDEGPRAAGLFAALALAVAVVPQVPFLTADSGAFIANILTIATEPLRPIGAGPSLLAPFFSAAYPRAAGICVAALLLAAAWRSAPLRGPAIWLLPVLALFAWPRFLHTYLVFFLPALLVDLLTPAPYNFDNLNPAGGEKELSEL